jgi:hypothetical protein
MNAVHSGFVLLAQYSRWKHMGDSFRRSGPRMDMADLMPAAVILALVVLGIVVAVQIYKRHDYSKPCDDPRKLFRQLCAAHKLNFRSRRLLLQLAAAHHLPQPSALFVTPAAFQTSELPPQLLQEEVRIKELAAKLF